MEGLNPFGGIPEGYTPEEFSALKLHANLQIKMLRRAGFQLNPYQGYVQALKIYITSYKDKPDGKKKLVDIYKDYENSKNKIQWIEDHSQPDPRMMLNRSNSR